MGPTLGKPLTRSLIAVGSLLVFACEDPLGSSEGGEPARHTVPTVNVRGRVVNVLGLPSPGARLLLRSRPGFSVEPLLDASGAFAADRVPTPYDALVFHQDRYATAPFKGVTATLGLTSEGPTLPDFMDASNSGLTAFGSLNGVVGGGVGFPTPDGYRTSVLFTSPEVRTPLELIADSNTGGYTTDQGAAYDYDWGPPPALTWFGSTTTVGTLHALQWAQTSGNSGAVLGAPTHYSGYGSRTNVALAADSTLSDQDIALSPVAPTRFSGVYTPPAGYEVQDRQVALSFGTGLMPIVHDLGGTEFSFSTPNIPGVTLVMSHVSSNGLGTSVAFEAGLAVDASGVSATSPPAAELDVPPNGTTVTARHRDPLQLERLGRFGEPARRLASGELVPEVHRAHVGNVRRPLGHRPAQLGASAGRKPTGGPSTALDHTPASRQRARGIVGDHPTYLNLQGGDLLNKHHSGFVTISPTWSFTVEPGTWDY